MNVSLPDDEQIRLDAQTRASIIQELQVRFAPEDEVLRGSLVRAQAENVPAIQVSPLLGKLLQVLALSCHARTILEIGTLTGYSGTWLARALPPDGKLITLEVNPKHAEIARTTFAEAGLGERVEIRVGQALDLLPELPSEAPFDLIFIDANKDNYPQYLEWALQLSHPGTIIVADNLVREGRAFQVPPPDEISAGVATYTHTILAHPRLVSAGLLSNDKGSGLDGFAISVVKDA